ADQLRVTALCLDHSRDGSGLTPRVCADEAVREMAVLRSLSIRLLDGVLTDEDPLVAAVDEGLDELVGHVGLVGKRHFCGREATHPAKRVKAKDGGKVMLPGLDVKAVVLDRRGGSHGVAPRAAQP